MPVENWLNLKPGNRFGPMRNRFKKHYDYIIQSIEDHYQTMLSLHPENKNYLDKFRAEQLEYWNKEYPEFAPKGGNRRQTKRKRSCKSKTRKY